MNLGLGQFLGMGGALSEMERLKKEKEAREQLAFINMLRQKGYDIDLKRLEIAEKGAGREEEEYARQKAIEGAYQQEVKGLGAPIAEPTEPFKQVGAGLSMMPGMATPGAMLQGLPPTIQRPQTREEAGREYRTLMERFPEKRPALEAGFKMKYPEEEVAEGYKTYEEIPKIPGMAVDTMRTEKGRLMPSWKRVDETTGEPTELFNTYGDCLKFIKTKGYDAIPKRDTKTGGYYPSYKEPTTPTKPTEGAIKREASLANFKRLCQMKRYFGAEGEWLPIENQQTALQLAQALELNTDNPEVRELILSFPVGEEVATWWGPEWLKKGKRTKELPSPYGVSPTGTETGYAYFEANGKTYKIPTNKVKEFLKDNPNAKSK